MKWLILSTFVAILNSRVTQVHSQCFTDNDRFNVVLQTNLSHIADFGLDLLRQFNGFNPEENVIFSPYSIWSALSLAYFGSAGETESQLQAALRTDSKIGTLRMHKALDLTYQLRNLIGVNYVFKLANKLYVDKALPFRNCTTNVLPNEIEHIDFRNIMKAVATINDFVSDTTEGRIKDLVDPDALSDAQLVIVNAAYFKGSWLHPFKSSMTHSAIFKTDKKEEELKMMHIKTSFKYVEDASQGIRLLELPYDDQVISMYLLLPSSAGDEAFEGVLSRLDGTLLQETMAGMTSKLVNLTVPKFTYEMTLQKELTQSLINIGVTDLFNQTTGNLTRYVEGMNMGVSESIHKAFIEVSEEGTEAAAATAFVISTRFGPVQMKADYVQFHCDRPFIYYLYDNDTNNILFLGTFRSPNSELGAVCRQQAVRHEGRQEARHEGSQTEQAADTEYEDNLSILICKIFSNQSTTEKAWPISVEAWPISVEAWPIPVEVWPILDEAWLIPVEAWPIPVEVWPIPVKAWPILVEAWPTPVEAWPIPVEVWPIPVEAWPILVKVWPIPVEYSSTVFAYQSHGSRSIPARGPRNKSFITWTSRIGQQGYPNSTLGARKPVQCASSGPAPEKPDTQLHDIFPVGKPYFLLVEFSINLVAMRWLSSLLLLGVIGHAHLQCLTPFDNYQAAQYSTDLTGITDFGLDLYKQLSPGNSPKNFFFSPYSIWSALALAYIGSGGATQQQLEAALRVSGKLETLKLLKALDNLYVQRSNNSLYTFNLANRAYVDGTLNLKDCAKNYLKEELRVVNFRDVAPTSKLINDFVAETTNGRISNIVNPGDLLDALMVLVNAAFFKGTWKYQFKSNNTQKKDFYITPRETAPLAMMAQKGNFNYGVSTELGARILELPYSGEDISMFLLLPSADLPVETRFANMVSKLNAVNLQSALNPENMANVNVDVQVPKFKFAMKLSDELEKGLKALGIVDIFEEHLADMSGFDPVKEMSLKKTVHKSFIEVNEEGTEAAAATALIFLTRSGVSRPPRVIEFHCNEPFIFIIHDNQTRNILFMGAIKNPRG
ncbi:uncharacterized protein [Palaemon carinicauda]|uniref:uncharacterized protein n=1 Tax=Palaemon carinicauda TaxID=392227 RepID=UPI0035B59D05